MESFLRGARRLWTATSGFGTTGGSSSSTMGHGNNNNNAFTTSNNNNGGGGNSNLAGNNNSGFVRCTGQPVGVDFPTKGGNFAFGICRNGDPPSAVATECIIYDPNEDQAFEGKCHEIDRMTRNGYLSNNMCAIARIRLDADCCSNPAVTRASLGNSWGVVP